MKLQRQNIYRYKVHHGQYENNHAEYREYDSTGIVAANNFGDACNKLVDYFGTDEILEMHLEFGIDCDVVEDNELLDLLDKVDK